MRILLPGISLLFATLTVHAADNIRVATFNINYGNVNLPDIERAIVEANADLVCIQESNVASERFLSRQLRRRYPHITFVGHEGHYFAERFGFLSKTKLTDVRYDPPVDGLFGTYFATLQHETQDIKVVNVHLSPFSIRRGSNLGQALRAIGAVEEVHQEEIGKIIGKLDLKHPTLVCGDFNSMSTFSAPMRLTGLGMTDSFAEVTKDADSQPTWRWPVGNGYIQFRIDYIFRTPHFDTIHSKIIPTTGSDHFMLVSELKLSNGE